MIYYVDRNEQLSGNHKIHTFTCSQLPWSDSKVYLGDFDNYKNALISAKTVFQKLRSVIYVVTAINRINQFNGSTE